MSDHDREAIRPRDVEAYQNTGTLSGFGPNETPAEEAIDRQPTDRRIHEEICTILAGNAQVPIEQLDVTVQEGVVTLRGLARDAHTRERAEDLSAMIAGVKSVRNELRAR